LLSCGSVAFLGGISFEYVLNLARGQYIALGLFALSYLMLGGKVLWRMLKNNAKGQICNENNLMGVATLGAIALGKYAEAVTVMLFYQIGEFLQSLAVAKSKRRIGDLMDIRPDYANVQRGGQLVKVAPEQVQIGDVFMVKPGEKIPLDGTVVDGEAMLDTTALTGESVPRRARAGDAVLSGCINQNGVLTIEATKAFGESTVSKILDLVENAANKKAKAETFITKFARWYTPAVVGAAALLAVIPPLILGGGWMDWISRALIFAGNAKLMESADINFTLSQTLGTVVYVTVDGVFAGSIVIADEIKSDSHGLVAKLKKLGLRKTVMLTGDTQQIAERVAGELEIDEVHAGLLPQQKVEQVEALQAQKQPKKTIAFVGDGINDAPVLAMADVGIGLFGLIPIALGIREIVVHRRERRAPATEKTPARAIGGVLNVTLVALANGADNIGIYVPTFAGYTTGQLIALVGIFAVMMALWCLLAELITKFPGLKNVLQKYEHIVVPTVFIGLGVYIIVTSELVRGLF